MILLDAAHSFYPATCFTEQIKILGNVLLLLVLKMGSWGDERNDWGTMLPGAVNKVI